MARAFPEDDDVGGDAPFTNGVTSPVLPTLNAPTTTSAAPKVVDDVVYSDIGITTLLSRLKQSIASAKDFALFLKKRSSIEEDHAKATRRLAKSTEEDIRKMDSRQGSYLRQLGEVLHIHERMADNGVQFSLSLHQMHEDTNELCTAMEKGRKQWKHDGLSAEKKATDAESMMDKAKSRYDGLAEDYDRAKTGDIKGTRRIMKGPKSAAQHEEDLLRKLQAADSDYAQKVQIAKAQREELIKTARPQAVKALQDLITECDSALTLQLQKFATFNEKLIVGNGMAVTPVNSGDGAPKHSMRDIIYGIDDEKDLHDHLGSQYSRIPAKKPDIKYEQHPTLLSKQQTPAPQNRQVSSTLPASQPTSMSTNRQVSQPLPKPSTSTFSSPALPPISTFSAPASQSTDISSGAPRQPTSTFQGPPAQQDSSSAGRRYSGERNGPSQQSSQPALNQTFASNGLPSQSKAPPYPTSPPASMRGLPSQQAVGMPYGNGPSPTQGPGHTLNGLPPPVRPVFGVDLDVLFQRDGSAVPMVVHQCMQAVDLFGLDVEGIYRLSGSSTHVSQLKALFDNDASRVDFRNPTAFFHDVNSVAGLLKQFFRDLPDPLLTRERYAGLIDAGRIDDDTVRRDSLHAIINSLPDANYATLRALVLHLGRVQEHSSNNRMSSSNVAICFAPTLMGSHSGPQIADAGLQARVLDTILENTYQIFDED